MQAKAGKVDMTAGNESAARTSMMEMWNESMERARQSRQTTASVAKEESESKADLEQRIRSGQEQCPTCAARTYRDDSSDGGVSFQAPKHIAASGAGVTIMSHECEHVGGEGKKARDEGGQVISGTVMLERCKCPECGRTYYSGGVTKTVTRTPAKRMWNGNMDMEA